MYQLEGRRTGAQAGHNRLLEDFIQEISVNAGSANRERYDLDASCALPAIALFAACTDEADLWARHHLAGQLYAVIKQHAPRHFTILPDASCRIGVIFSWDDLPFVISLHRILSSGGYRFAHGISLGISNPYPQLSGLPHCYEQAAAALKHRYYRNDSQPIFFDEIEPYAYESEYPESEEERLFQMISGSCSPHSIEQGVDAFYTTLLRNGPLPENKVIDATLQLLISLQLRLKADLGQSLPSITPELTELLQLQTLQGTKRRVSDTIIATGRAAAAAETANSTLIKKAVAWMENEYDRASLHYIADKMFITPAYLSTLFKSTMGVTFIEHLTRIRITKAKQLLKQTHLKNYEVAERVGYHDSRYFSQIFKKKVGLSPSEFRDAN